MIWLLPHPLPLSRKQDISLSQSSCVSPFELTDGREGDEVEEEAESYDGEKAWSSIITQYSLTDPVPFALKNKQKNIKTHIFCCRFNRLHPPTIAANTVTMASSVLILLLHSSQFLNPKKL
jgi:hypothetical protein